MIGRILVEELRKIRHTRITWITWLAISVMPLVCGMFMWIVREPERAARLGLIGQKAQFTGASADWSSYLTMLLQTVGIGGMILVSVIAAYVFGREYAEGTMKDLLTLPIARHWLVIAKLLTVLVWFGLLMVWLIAEGLVVGWLMQLSGYSTAVVRGGIGDLLLAALVGWLLVPMVAWVAEAGKGYLAPLGFTIFMLVLGMVVGATGWGKWFPWSIVPLFAGVAGPRVEMLAPASVFVLIGTFIAGTLAAILHLRYADHAG